MKKNKINRRSFIKKAAIPVIGAASIGSFNVHASNINELSMVTSWPENFPGIGLGANRLAKSCLLYTSPSPRDATLSRMPSSA